MFKENNADDVNPKGGRAAQKLGLGAGFGSASTHIIGAGYETAWTTQVG